MNLKTVKNVINKTKCKEYMCSGAYCSEPIMSKDDNGIIIDNYFIYSRSSDFSTVEVPEVAFGIYSDSAKVAYIDSEIAKRFEKYSFSERFESVENMKDANNKYSEVYPIIRLMYDDKEPRDNEIIDSYLRSLEVISGETVFGFYQTLFPSFFTWVKDR